MTHHEIGNITEAELVRRLGELPRRVEPRNDPWPQILERITAREMRRSAAGNLPWLRLAAAVVMAFALGMFFGNSWRQQSPATPAVTAAARNAVPESAVPNLGGALVGVNREYQAAFSEFIHIGQSADELKPSTLDAIERDWQEMLEAESALTAALRQYPNNPWLNKRMLELREHQLAMLKQLAGMDRISRRTQI